MESPTEKYYWLESSFRRGFKRLWLRMSRCESMEGFVLLLFQLEHLLNSQFYSPKKLYHVISSRFHPKSNLISQNQRKISFQLVQWILYHAVLTNSPYDGLRCSKLSHEIARIISQNLMPSSISSLSLLPITSSLDLEGLMAKCLTARHASKPDKPINYLKYLWNDEHPLGRLVQSYYRRRSLKLKNTLPQLKCIFNFADQLSKDILDNLHTSLNTSVKSELNKPCTSPGISKINRRHYHPAASPTIVKAAERLEESIMREALTSLRRLRRFQNHQTCHQHNYFSSLKQNPSTSKQLNKVADDIASQIMKEASVSAGKRMDGIRRITDSVLQSISQVESSDLKSALANDTLRLFEIEIPLTLPESDRSTRLGNYAGNLTFQCLSEALKSLRKSQQN